MDDSSKARSGQESVKRHVALIVETSSVYGREVLAGVVQFMRLRNDWSVFLEQRDLRKQPPSWLEAWRGHGIISRATTPKLREAIARTRVPLVDLTDRRGDPEHPWVRSDDGALGRLAAEHLLERGFERFGFCGFSGEAWSQRRERAFVDCVQDAGATCVVYNSPWHGPAARSWDDEQHAITQWLTSIPPPLAVMACNDVRGQHVIDACEKACLAVPEEAAVIGVDNDELLCQICSPPLSSVIPNARQVGFRAAEMLSQWMEGQVPDPPGQLIKPLGIATRQSTDVVAIENQPIATALHFIRQHACQGITVGEVAAHAEVSRSTLERQLRKYLGRTPQEEIRYVQIKKAQELLYTSELSVERIAALCGFEHPEYMHVVFRRLTGTTPGEYRRGARR